MSNTTPVRITDKNGKATTVHKNLNRQVGAGQGRVAKAAPPTRPVVAPQRKWVGRGHEFFAGDMYPFHYMETPDYELDGFRTEVGSSYLEGETLHVELESTLDGNGYDVWEHMGNPDRIIDGLTSEPLTDERAEELAREVNAEGTKFLRDYFENNDAEFWVTGDDFRGDERDAAGGYAAALVVARWNHEREDDLRDDDFEEEFEEEVARVSQNIVIHHEIEAVDAIKASDIKEIWNERYGS